MIRRVVVATLAVLVSAAPVRALQEPQASIRLLRSQFTTDDGLPGAVVDQAEQARDGFLWLIVSGSILSRFDGRSFYYFDKPRPRTLAVAPDGALWVGTNEELVHIPPSDFNQFTLTRLTSYHPGPGRASRILCLRFSRSGVLWVGTADGLFRYAGDRFEPLGPRVGVRQIEEAPDGRVLVTTEQEFFEVAGSEVTLYPALPDRLGIEHGEIFDVLRDRRGTTWYLTAMGVARETRGRLERLGTYARPGHAAYRAHEDAHGTVWIGKDEGLFRATPAGLELIAAGMQVRSFSNDHDGNLWVGTNGDGLHRFKEPAVRTFTTEDGLPDNVLMTVLAAHDGTVWTGANCGGISRFDGTRFHTYDERHGLLNGCVWALAEDSNHDLWIGTHGGGAFHYRNGSFAQYSKAQGMADDVVTSIVVARDGAVWFGTRSGVSRLKNGQLRNFTTADGLSSNTTNRVFEDRAGVIWVGNHRGLDRLVGDRFEALGSFARLDVVPLGEDRDGGFFVLAEVGAGTVTYRLAEKRLETIQEIGAFDLVETERGELWLASTTIIRVLPGRLAHPRARDEPLDHEVFSTADGFVTTGISGGKTLALTPDGRLWVATLKGLVVFDLRRLPITDAKPSVYLTDVTIGRSTAHAGREVVLPPGTSHAEIGFAAVEISSPEKIRFQYRLDDVDREWLDAPANPRAIYSRIPVGTHALHIRACNRNGIWDRQGLVFTVTQQPYFHQTRLFTAMMVAFGLLLVVGLVRLRVRQLSRAMSDRFDERLAERTRVARDLHDTFLQTVQGSKLVADHVLKNPADHARLLRAVEQLAGWLGRATEEGRAALNSLRTSATEKNNLAESLRGAIEECRLQTDLDGTLSVSGEARDLHPIVRDEIYRIGYEAIRNACSHSRADALSVTLEYAHDLRLQVSDDGVGVDPTVSERGREGHFGFSGMRERAERIGGKLTIDSAPSSGTTIHVVVPGRVAYRIPGSGRLKRIASVLFPD